MSKRLNLLAPEVLADPYPHYAELRRSAPVSQVDPGGFYLVTRLDDAMFALKNPQLFATAGREGASAPKYGRLRSLASRAFGPGAMAGLEQRVRTLARGLVERLPMGQPMDWVSAFARPLPASVIGALLGMDPAQHARFARWADELTGAAPESTDMRVQIEKVQATVREAEQYMGEVLALRRREPGDDLLTELLRIQAEGEPLTDADLTGFLFILLVAGQESTAQLLNHAARVFMAHPEVLSRVRAELSLVPKLVEELLRYEPPVSAVSRLATEEVELGGVRIPKGARVLISLCSAIRDEAHFPDAERFDLDRGGVHNLPFGHGVHFCLGAALARFEGKLALEALLPRIQGVSAAGPAEWKRSFSVRGVQVLPLIAHPA